VSHIRDVTELSSLGVTPLLQRWGDGDRAAFDQLVPIVYDALRRLAHERRRGERSDLSVNTTALVHEAYLKLVDLRQARFRDRAHFLAMASRVMRRLLVDHARARKADKRGNDPLPLEFDEALCLSDENAALLADLNDALERLEAVDSRASHVLEQHYFGGLTLEETAEALGVSLATVKRDLRFARALLTAELSADHLEGARGRSG
jgi:RNA polymerase sigma factor (TIGR02999 family)